ncbi:hypothetical protein Vadar_023679 [Vaccinium darrowii]|uniref:Uncharacterized protein n=1 Tax=Vaccinium darrowii TaxID=229202 RepID=A0ACB7YQA8_9ERIC|nr:hypothetical protein Vadar_023679 [Vaccinium darrowii]
MTAGEVLVLVKRLICSIVIINTAIFNQPLVALCNSDIGTVGANELISSSSSFNNSQNASASDSTATVGGSGVASTTLGSSLELEWRFSGLRQIFTNFVGNVKILPNYFIFWPKIFNFKAEIGIFEDAGATNGEFVEGEDQSPRGGGGGEIGDDGGDGVGALGFATAAAVPTSSKFFFKLLTGFKLTWFRFNALFGYFVLVITGFMRNGFTGSLKSFMDDQPVQDLLSQGETGMRTDGELSEVSLEGRMNEEIGIDYDPKYPGGGANHHPHPPSQP